MADAKRQKDTLVNEEEQRNAPNRDKTSSGNQQTSQDNKGEFQDTRKKPEENPAPGRRR